MKKFILVFLCVLIMIGAVVWGLSYKSSKETDKVVTDQSQINQGFEGSAGTEEEDDSYYPLEEQLANTPNVTEEPSLTPEVVTTAQVTPTSQPTEVANPTPPVAEWQPNLNEGTPNEEEDG